MSAEVEPGRYAAGARLLLRIGRIGKQYPEARRLDALLEALERRGQPIRIDPRSGLPSLTELSAIRADLAVAPEFLAAHAARLQERVPYFRWLSTVTLPSPSETDARLVARLGGGITRLRVVHDTLDPANGCWVRLAAVVDQKDTVLVSFEREDLCVPRPALSEALERCAGADAELAFLLLAAIPGVTVQEVVRGQVGPLHGGGLPPPPAELPAGIATAEGPALLHLLLERSAPDVAEDRCRDPLSQLYRDALAPGARAAAEARRAELGYRTSKERRLICAPSLEAELRRWSREAGTPLVIRSR